MAVANPRQQLDRFDLQRFVEAQAGIYSQALAEICAGRKQSHWMWFIFPQFVGLGSSPTARRYAIKGKAEAVACLEHPVPGRRLAECAEAALAVDGRSATQIFGVPDGPFLFPGHRRRRRRRLGIRKIRLVTPDVAIVDIDNEVHGVKAMPVGVIIPPHGVLRSQLNNWWVALFAFPALAIVHVIAVLPEEAYLSGKFGESYRTYLTQVRRYL